MSGRNATPKPVTVRLILIGKAGPPVLKTVVQELELGLTLSRKIPLPGARPVLIIRRTVKKTIVSQWLAQ